MRLSKAFVRDNAPQSEGTVRVNHNEGGCSGDSDSCVIRMDGYGNLSAKCYRCGAWRVEESQAFTKRGKAVSTVIKRQASLPKDASPDLHSAPVQAIKWLEDAHISLTDAKRYGLQWSEYQKRLYIPALNPKQRWWTGRSFAADAARYKTIAEDKSYCFGMAFASKNSLQNEIWIVEDLLSMYRLADAGADSLALCTTSISDSAVAMLAKLGYNKAVLSLDNDNPQVIMANSKIAQRLGWMASVKRSVLETDAKHYTQEQLKEIIHGN